MAERRAPRGGVRRGGLQGGPTPALVMSGAVALLALPSAVLAFSNRIDVPAGIATDRAAGFDANSSDPRLARDVARPHLGGLFRFTPAGLAERPDRSVTVAVRVDADTARAIIVRGVVPAPARAATADTALHIAPTAYTLGLTRGLQGFVPSAQAYVLPTEKAHGDMPDLASFRNDAAPGSPSRLAAHLSLEQQSRAGRAPSTLEGSGEQSVDVGGSYRLTRNLDVTAGLRYSEDRDRLRPLTDGKTDGQAVFVGTQFHF